MRILLALTHALRHGRILAGMALSYHDKTAFVALMREDLVARHYRSLGYDVLSEDDGQTRALLELPATSKAADVIVRVHRTEPSWRK